MAERTTIPAEIQQGTDLAITLSLGDYPAGTWTATLTLQSDQQRKTVTATASGQNHLFTIAAATSADWRPNWYRWQLHVATLAGGRELVDEGVLAVLPDVAATQVPPIDGRSFARRMLDRYNEMFAGAGFLTSLQPEQIEGLENIRRRFEWDVKRETDAAKLKAGGQPTRKIYTRFA